MPEIAMLYTFLPTSAGYLREFAEVAVLSFFVAGVINAVINTQAVANCLGGNVLVANGASARSGPDPEARAVGLAETPRAAEENPDSDAVDGASSGSRARHPTAKSIRRENRGGDESTANTRFDLTSTTGGNSG